MYEKIKNTLKEEKLLYESKTCPTYVLFYVAFIAYICNCWSITVPNTLKGRPVIAGASVSKHTVSHPVQLRPTVRASKMVFKGDALSTATAHVTTVIHSYCRKHNYCKNVLTSTVCYWRLFTSTTI